MITTLFRNQEQPLEGKKRSSRPSFHPSGLGDRLSRIPLILLALSLASPTMSFAQAIVSASPDVTINLGSGVVIQDQEVALDNQLGLMLRENLGPLPASSDVVAFASDLSDDRLISFDTTTALPGNLIARRGDIVRFNGTTYSIDFDATDAGVPESAGTDAVSISPGGLLLSFDTTVVLPGGLVVADEDLVEWDGAHFNLLLDGSSAGMDLSLDIDGGQAVGGGAFLVSFDTGGLVGGVAFSDEDILRYDGANWSLEVDSSGLNPAWIAADLDSVMVPEPALNGMLLAGSINLCLLAGKWRSRTLRAASQKAPQRLTQKSRQPVR